MGDVSTAKSLINAGDIINIIIAILAAVGLIITIVGIIIAWVPLVLAWWTHKRSKEAEQLIDDGNYEKAKSILIVPSIISLLFVSFIGGLLILIGALMLPQGNGENKVENSAIIQ